jgi:hypothetical protein
MVCRAPGRDLRPMTSPQNLRRTVFRGAVVVISLALIALWIRFGYGMFTTSQQVPAPAAIMLPVFFSVVALGAGMAALRGEGVTIALAGGLSLVPMGLLLVFFPGSPRAIGLLDICLIALGVVLMRGENPRVDADDEADAAPDAAPDAPGGRA